MCISTAVRGKPLCFQELSNNHFNRLYAKRDIECHIFLSVFEMFPFQFIVITLLATSNFITTVIITINLKKLMFIFYVCLVFFSIIFFYKPKAGNCRFFS